MDEKEGLDEEFFRSREPVLEQHLAPHQACCSKRHSGEFVRGQFGYPASSSFFSVTYLVTLHIVCLFLGLCLLFTWTQAFGGPKDTLLDFDTRYPDWIPVSYELQHNDIPAKQPSIYAGPPNEANTKAWDNLIRPSFFSVSPEDLRKIGESVNDSVRLAQGGYIASLDVYHNIHCLRRLRIFLHSDYYYDNLTEANMQYLRGHLGHCIESLRRSIQCNADITIVTFTWKDAQFLRPGSWRPKPKSNQERKCVKWEAIEDWAKERQVALNPVMLKPGGEEERILMV